jgi:glycosyltransferase involved in cell wall biosynthesis
VGSVSEVIENEVTGLLVEVTLGELPAKMRRLIENEDLRLAMSKKASERAHRNFGVDSLVSSHVGFYERILNS